MPGGGWGGPGRGSRTLPRCGQGALALPSVDDPSWEQQGPVWLNLGHLGLDILRAEGLSMFLLMSSGGRGGSAEPPAAGSRPARIRKWISRLLMGTALWEETTSRGPGWGVAPQVPEGPALDAVPCTVGRTCCLPGVPRLSPEPWPPCPPGPVLTVGGSCPHCPGLLSPAALCTPHLTVPFSSASA